MKPLLTAPPRRNRHRPANGGSMHHLLKPTAQCLVARLKGLTSRAYWSSGSRNAAASRLASTQTPTNGRLAPSRRAKNRAQSGSLLDQYKTYRIKQVTLSSLIGVDPAAGPRMSHGRRQRNASKNSRIKEFAMAVVSARCLLCHFPALSRRPGEKCVSVFWLNAIATKPPKKRQLTGV